MESLVGVGVVSGREGGIRARAPPLPLGVTASSAQLPGSNAVRRWAVGLIHSATQSEDAGGSPSRKCALEL